MTLFFLCVIISFIGTFNIFNIMTPPKRYIHEDIGEENLWIDLSILTFLREEMLLGNLDYVSLRESHKQGLFSSDVDCSWERFRRRALYQV